MLKLLIYLLIAQVGLILAARKFLLWYLKINRALEILRSIDASLKCLPSVQESRTQIKMGSSMTERARGSQTREPMEGSAGYRTSAAPADPA